MLKFDFTIIFQFEKTRTQNCNNRKSFKNNFSCFNVNTFLQASIQKCFTYRVLSKNISLRKNIKLSNSAQTKLREEGFYCYNFVRHCMELYGYLNGIEWNHITSHELAFKLYSKILCSQTFIATCIGIGYLNQSRICGKGVCLSLFPSDSLSFESYEQFVRKSKKSKNDCFLAIFGLNLAMFLTSQPYEFNEIAHKGP